MNRRLQQLLDLEGLTQAQFAEHIGVGRASISHILNGRNKPGYDIIASILRRFPEISPDWLIMGKGKPFRDKEPVPSTLFLGQDADTNAKREENVSLDAIGQQSEYKEDTEQESNFQPIENELLQDSFENDGRIIDTESLPPRPKRKIKRITVYYDDNTFEELFK